MHSISGVEDTEMLFFLNNTSAMCWPSEEEDGNVSISTLCTITIIYDYTQEFKMLLTEDFVSCFMFRNERTDSEILVWPKSEV